MTRGAARIDYNRAGAAGRPDRRASAHRSMVHAAHAARGRAAADARHAFPSNRRRTMALTRQVVSTLNNDGTDVMGPNVLAFHYPDENLVSGSLLTVEANHFAVLKSRGAVLGVYDTGQYPIQTPDKPLLGSIVTGFFGGQSPWQYEVLYVNRAKLLVRNTGIGTSAEMAEMAYQVEYYVHVDSKDDALKLITHMPFAKHFIGTDEVASYAGPVVEQAINQVIQVTPMEKINEHIHEIVELVKEHLGSFLGVYGVTLNDAKVLILPKDERMRELISLRAFGLSGLDAVRYYVALKMAEKGLVSAPNAAVGEPFFIGGATMGTFPVTNALQPAGPGPATGK
jgi:membrane protease subunit (stomatin/prohibitin family)